MSARDQAGGTGGSGGTRRQGWRSLQQDLLRRINAREWPPGGLLPGEVALAEEYGCARATVNRALRGLAEAGVIERRRKAGTRVALNPVRKATLDIPVLRFDIERRGAVHGYRLLGTACALPPAAVLERLGLAPGTRLLHVRAVHLGDGVPQVLEDRWVNTAAVPAIREADLSRTSANEWLVLNAPFAGGDLAISAEAADAADADALAIRPGTAILVMRRTTWTAEAPITHVRLAYAPGHVIHSTT